MSVGRDRQGAAARTVAPYMSAASRSLPVSCAHGDEGGRTIASIVSSEFRTYNMVRSVTAENLITGDRVALADERLQIVVVVCPECDGPEPLV